MWIVVQVVSSLSLFIQYYAEYFVFQEKYLWKIWTLAAIYGSCYSFPLQMLH
jgi:hypothetical protein